MSKEDHGRVATLEEANEQLKASLTRCRELLADCRSKLEEGTNDAAAQAPRHDQLGEKAER